MKISVIIPAFNEEKLIATTLERIAASTAAFNRLKWSVETIVCDNNSTDRTAEIARAAGARVIFEPINQISRARNAGASGASGDWLIFVDADSHPSDGLFADVADAIQSGRVIAGGSTIAIAEKYLAPQLAVRGWNLLSRFRRWAAGSFIFCETAAFREIGGFSTELFVSEEIDLSKRLQQLARQRGKTMTILRRHPIVTSVRKLHLYSTREHFQFLGRLIFQRGRPLKNREECAIWYDGRR